MAKQQASTLRAQWLGQQLRQMREAAGLTLKQVGDYINRDASTVSRLESGVVAARVPEVLAYLDVCGVDDRRRRDDLTAMAKDAWQKGWWDGFNADVVAGQGRLGAFRHEGLWLTVNTPKELRTAAEHVAAHPDWLA